MTDNKRVIGGTIRMLRLEQGLSVADLADAIGVSAQSVEHYENNTWQPGRLVLGKLAELFQITVPEILSGYNLLYDEQSHEFLAARSMGGNVIRIIGKVKKNAVLLEEDDTVCGNR